MNTITRLRPWYMPLMSPFDDETEKSGFQMGINVYTKDGVVHVEAPVPGMTADDVEVTLSDSEIHINAQAKEEEKEKEAGQITYQMERATSFSYVVDLPSTIDEKTIEAKVKDGVLTVTAKTAEIARAKKVAVKSA